MFKAHIEKDWRTSEVSVYLVDRDVVKGAQTYFQVKDGELWGTTITAGAEIPGPLMRLPLEAVEALGQALANVLPPSAATQVHLTDAIEVRNRLLAVVENMCVAQLPFGASRGPQ